VSSANPVPATRPPPGAAARCLHYLPTCCSAILGEHSTEGAPLTRSCAATGNTCPHMHTDVRMHMHMHIKTHIHTHAHAHTLSHTHTHAHTHAHALSHTHTHTQHLRAPSRLLGPWRLRLMAPPAHPQMSCMRWGMQRGWLWKLQRAGCSRPECFP